MGGGGGSYFRSDPETLRQKLRQAEERTEDEAYEGEVAQALASLLTEYNDRDVEAVRRHLGEIENALLKELEGTIELIFGGSVAKHTFVDGLSDIDSLVVLDSCELASGTPDAAKEYFAQRLRERFPRTNVTAGTLAVTVHFSDIDVQLLPAISCQNNVKISNKTGHDWAKIKPKEFTEVLTKTNQRVGNKVVPVVKLAKAIIANLPEKHQISGYHAESLAVAIFRNYQGEQKLKPMLKHYFSEGSRLVQEPVRDRTGQSVHVDDYLGSPKSLERQIVSDAFSRVHRRMNNADSAKSINEWHKFFGEA